MKKILFIISLAAVCLQLRAQRLTVTGKVVDGSGLEVIGANITIKGQAGIGTITNIDGHYSLTVNDAQKDVLVFSYIGMTTLEIAVKGRNKIDVTLKDDANLLDLSLIHI